MKLLIIVRGDRTGLGYQTRNLTRMLNPHRILYIDSTVFNGKQQNYDWYADRQGYFSKGFPTDAQTIKVLKDVTHLFTCETAYNYSILRYARMRGIKTYIQTNWEFLDYKLTPRLTPPDHFIMPSHWHVEDMKNEYGSVRYLPPPTFGEDFKDARRINTERSGNRFLHIVGTQASEDRNGTQSLVDALKWTDADFELVIRAQGDVKLNVNDPRVTIERTDIVNQEALYTDFDALILPRRYGGLCLPMNEALVAGLPVFMTDISPNNQVLPKRWLFRADPDGGFMAKQFIELYKADPTHIARVINWWCALTAEQKLKEKLHAIIIGKQYTPEVLEQEYEKLW